MRQYARGGIVTTYPGLAAVAEYKIGGTRRAIQRPNTCLRRCEIEARRNTIDSEHVHLWCPCDAPILQRTVMMIRCKDLCTAGSVGFVHEVPAACCCATSPSQNQVLRFPDKSSEACGLAPIWRRPLLYTGHLHAGLAPQPLAFSSSHPLRPRGIGASPVSSQPTALHTPRASGHQHSRTTPPAART